MVLIICDTYIGYILIVQIGTEWAIQNHQAILRNLKQSNRDHSTCRCISELSSKPGVGKKMMRTTAQPVAAALTEASSGEEGGHGVNCGGDGSMPSSHPRSHHTSSYPCPSLNHPTHAHVSLTRPPTARVCSPRRLELAAGGSGRRGSGLHARPRLAAGALAGAVRAAAAAAHRAR